MDDAPRKLEILIDIEPRFHHFLFSSLNTLTHLGVSKGKEELYRKFTTAKNYSKKIEETH